MKYRLVGLIFCFELMVTSPSFAAEANVQSTPPAVAHVPEEPLPVLGVPQGYRYESHGRRDPFVNPIPKPPPASVVAEVKPERPPGLKGALVSEVALLGVFVAKDDASMTRAILQVPGMKAPVIAIRGESLFDGVIKEIRPDAVVFTRAVSGKISSNPAEGREVVKRVSSAGDKK
jgi:hypothetical protein